MKSILHSGDKICCEAHRTIANYTSVKLSNYGIAACVYGNDTLLEKDIIDSS